MAKRFTKPTINWVELEKRVPVEQKNNFYAFKGKSDAYLQRFDSLSEAISHIHDAYSVLANPAEMPKIDWETYKKLIPDKNLVDKFKGELEKYKVPYPQDTMTTQIDEQWKTLQKDIEVYCKEHEVEIDKATKELNRIKALPKFEDMTMEMYHDLYPNEALDPVKKPSFWPHTPEEQPGYKTPEQQALKKKGGH